MQDVWVEKYRPRKLSDVIGQKSIVERLSAYVKTRSMPHMMFAGP
ncbi:MAG TPA: Replication factor C small subunit, partial [Thermoplasmata archaeon]